ncbi:MAG: ComEA family DNA-binding protein [Planctomycetaceae bacterium]
MSDGILHPRHDEESHVGSATIDSSTASSTDRIDDGIEPGHESSSVPANDAALANDISPEKSRCFGLSRGDQIFLGSIAGLLLLLMLAHALKASRWSLQTVELVHHPEREWEFHLDINTATWVEWMQLEGIGERLALRIVEDRKTNGPFKSIDDLTRVLGIGPKTIERLKPHLRCDPGNAEVARRQAENERSEHAPNE